MATFWAARSVSNLFSLYFVYLLYLFISCFGIKSGICLLIAPVPVHCFSLTFAKLPVLRVYPECVDYVRLHTLKEHPLWNVLNNDEYFRGSNL